MYREKNTNLWCRENTLDEYVIKEQSSYSELFSRVSGSVVMDIGGNIGAFAYRAYKSGAKRVISFEPDPENIKMYKKQNFPSNIKLIERAISNHTGKAEFYVNTGKNKGLHSLQAINGRECIQVKTASFNKALEKYTPDYIKIDIEGGEYNLDFSNLPEYIKGIAIEIHLTHGNNRALGKRLLNQLQQQFPVVKRVGNVTDKNWTTTFIGFREEI